MSTFTETFNGVGQKLGPSLGLSGAGKLAGVGASSGLIKIPLLLLVLPIGTAMIGLLLVGRGIASVGWNVWKWVVTKPVPTLLIVASASWLGCAGWMAFEYLQQHRLAIAAGSRSSESYKLAQALQTSTSRNSPRLHLAVLEIEAAANGAGVLEKGVVQLAIAPSDATTGSSARRVGLLPGSPPQVLLVRNDVDEQVVYVLTQALTQLGEELAAPQAGGQAGSKAAPQPPAAQTQKSPTKSATPLHPGAAAFYDRDKTSFVRRYAKLSVLVSAGLVLLGLWVWQGIRRARPRQKMKRDERSFAGLPEREVWTFSKILLESAGGAPTPLPVSAVAPDEDTGWQGKLRTSVEAWGHRTSTRLSSLRESTRRRLASAGGRVPFRRREASD